MTYPTAPDRYIACGDSRTYNVLDDDGQIRTIRVVARPPSRTGGDGTKPNPVTTSPGGNLQSEIPYGAAARIMAEVRGRQDLIGPRFDADLLLTPDIARSLRPGARLQVPVWRVDVTRSGRITVVLPEEIHRDTMSGGMIFVPEPGGQ